MSEHRRFFKFDPRCHTHFEIIDLDSPVIERVFIEESRKVKDYDTRFDVGSYNKSTLQLSLAMLVTMTGQFPDRWTISDAKNYHYALALRLLQTLDKEKCHEISVDLLNKFWHQMKQEGKKTDAETKRIFKRFS